MFELLQATERAYYVNAPAKIGIYKTGENEVCFIDSGNDKDAGRKLRQILEQNNWHLTAIYNTHSNADHIGGNKYLQSQTQCKIFAPGIERDFTCRPILESAFLYGGYPPAELRHKFLMAQESDAEYLTEEALPEGLSAFPLPGHFFDMTGYRTEDGAVYLADCLSSAATLEKYRIGYVYDVAAYLETLKKVEAMDGRIFIPAHADATESIAPLARLNIENTLRVAEDILALCVRPLNFEALLQSLFKKYSLTMNFEQYVLVGSTLRCYLAWLKDKGELTVEFSTLIPLWQKK